MLGREWKQFQASRAQSRSKRRSTTSAARTAQSLSALIPGHNRSLVSGLDIPSSHSQAGRDVLEKHDIIITDRPLQINHLRSASFRRVLSQDGRKHAAARRSPFGFRFSDVSPFLRTFVKSCELIICYSNRRRVDAFFFFLPPQE